jgi:hypothetical protein
MTPGSHPEKPVAAATAKLTLANYAKGFLVDDELMAGVSEHPDHPGEWLGFVLRHTSGEYLGYRSFPTLELALAAINAIPRDWRHESASGCGGCAQGACQNGKCGKAAAANCATGGCSI